MSALETKILAALLWLATDGSIIGAGLTDGALQTAFVFAALFAVMSLFCVIMLVAREA